ncbi:hypothetical protein J1605_009174 [Eschrichtius robustus]|uniref:Uncharacterized protein n=1 Tax=Eschrichtius robustus TaxID=9764 RepID=A0AB34GYI0_ESCRO|nr:hypothetical protein J1605_009174 [Eschrichtius robustus]
MAFAGSHSEGPRTGERAHSNPRFIVLRNLPGELWTRSQLRVGPERGLPSAWDPDASLMSSAPPTSPRTPRGAVVPTFTGSVDPAGTGKWPVPGSHLSTSTCAVRCGTKLASCPAAGRTVGVQQRVQTRRTDEAVRDTPSALTGPRTGPGSGLYHRAPLPLGNWSGRGALIGRAPRSRPLVRRTYFT